MTSEPCEHCSRELSCDCADALETEAWRADIAPRCDCEYCVAAPPFERPRAFSAFGAEVLGLTREDLS